MFHCVELSLCNMQRIRIVSYSISSPSFFVPLGQYWLAKRGIAIGGGGSGGGGGGGGSRPIS